MDLPENPILSLRATINPYRAAVGMLAQRIAWDARLESWRSRRILKQWKDRHFGAKAVILCNGPSLNAVDLGGLNGVFCFGLNKIDLLFDRSPFRPDCIVAVNPLVIEQNAAFYNKTHLPLFLGSIGLRHVKPRPNIAFLHSSPIPKFARDVSVSIHEGHTVTFAALQIAFHMGFREVALVGADHDFGTAGPANAVTRSGPRDEAHFDPRYFANQLWQLPDLVRSEASYAMAREVYAAFDGRVVNASEGGKLEVFERQTLAAFLSG